MSDMFPRDPLPPLVDRQREARAADVRWQAEMLAQLRRLADASEFMLAALHEIRDRLPPSPPNPG